MIAAINTQSMCSLIEVLAFLHGNVEAKFSPPPEADRPAWLAAILCQFHFGTLKRYDKEVVGAFASRSPAIRVRS